MEFEDDVDLRSDNPPANTPKEPVTLTLAGYEAQWVYERVAQIIAAQATQEVRRQAEKTVLETVSVEVERYVEEQLSARITSEVDSIIAEGWTQTDSYGYGSKKMTIRERINESLKASGNGGYNNGSNRSINGLAEKAIEAAVVAEFKEVQPSIRAMIDKTVKDKLAQSLKSALGLS
jgi:hypothetical protein